MPCPADGNQCWEMAQLRLLPAGRWHRGPILPTPMHQGHPAGGVRSPRCVYGGSIPYGVSMGGSGLHAAVGRGGTGPIRTDAHCSGPIQTHMWGRSRLDPHTGIGSFRIHTHQSGPVWSHAPRWDPKLPHGHKVPDPINHVNHICGSVQVFYGPERSTVGAPQESRLPWSPTRGSCPYGAVHTSGVPYGPTL